MLEQLVPYLVRPDEARIPDVWNPNPLLEKLADTTADEVEGLSQDARPIHLQEPSIPGVAVDRVSRDDLVQCVELSG